MLKNPKAITIISGATSIASTILFYLLTFDNIFTVPMRWVSLVFLIFTEAIGTIKILSMKKSIFGVPNIITSLLHLGIVLILSIIFVNFLPLLIKTYILLNVFVLCILLVVDVIFIYFAGYVDAKNKALDDSKAVLETLYVQAKSLLIEYQESGYKKDLEEISEMLMYSDNSTLSTDEVIISDKLAELKTLLSTNDESIPQKLSDVKNAIKLRSLKIKSTKRGNY